MNRFSKGFISITSALTKILPLHCHLRANREEVPPSSIPNLEVKLFFADDTATFRCGKVGRCGDESVKIKQ